MLNDDDLTATSHDEPGPRGIHNRALASAPCVLVSSSNTAAQRFPTSWQPAITSYPHARIGATLGG